MWIKLFLSGFVICLSLSCFSQEPPFKYGEIEWVENLRTVSIEQQLELIKQRLLSDTLVYANYTGDRLVSKPTRFKNRIDVVCRPYLIIDNHLLNINNDTEGKKVKQLCELLTTSNIRSIEVLEENKALGLFATEGKCGVIYLKPKKGKLPKTIKKLGL